MTPANGTATRQQSGIGAGPKTAAEASAKLERLQDREAELVAELDRLDSLIRGADLADAYAAVEQYEAQREDAAARLARVRRQAAAYAAALPDLRKTDRRAEAEAHRLEAARLEREARPFRKLLHEHLTQALCLLNGLDDLAGEHRGHARAYSAILEGLAKAEHPNITRAVELPQEARMVDAREGLRMLWTALASDGPLRDPDRFQRDLGRALAPLSDCVEDEEEE